MKPTNLPFLPSMCHACSFGFSAEGVAEGFKVAHLCEPGTVKVMFNL